MKRHSALINLSRDHHNGLITAQLLKINAPLYKGLPETTEDKIRFIKDFFNKELSNHFLEEEEILFPFIEKESDELAELTKKLTQDHSELKQLIISLDETIEKEKQLDQIGKLLEAHIRYEERKLFEKIQNILSNDKLNELEKRLTRKQNLKE